MKKASIFTAVLFMQVISSCNTKESNPLLYGEWRGAEWLIEGSASNRNVAETYFSFDPGGNYSFGYGGTIEKGTYKVENDMLFTKPEGQAEIMVKISKLTNNILQL
jgi:hypothetical protein